MRFQSWSSFNKHLDDSTPHDLSAVYLIIAPCTYETKKICERILASIKRKSPSLELHQFDVETASCQQVIEQLNTRSLFAASSAVIYHGLDRVKKNRLESLLDYVEKPSSSSYLILSSMSAKNTAELYQKGKKEVVVLDLSDEKPWDRKNRLHRYMIDYALIQGKTLALNAAQHLIDHIGLDLPILEQELFKLACYVGEKKTIELKDTQQVCSAEKMLSMRQLSETIVWESKATVSPKGIDLSWLLPFLGQLRYQLQTGLQLAVMIDSQIAIGDMIKHFPQLRNTLFDKRKAVAQEKGACYFQTGLRHLFDVEILAKNNGGGADFLFDLLIAKLAQVR